MPNTDTPWTLESGETLSQDSPVTLVWDNGAGLVFRRTIAVDDDYMFTVTQSVTNTGEAAVRLAPYGLIARHGEPADLKGFFILHEGVIRQTGEQLNEIDLLRPAPTSTPIARWGARGRGRGHHRQRLDRLHRPLLDDDAHPRRRPALHLGRPSTTAERRHLPDRGAPADASTVAPGADRSRSPQRLFAGAKEWETIRDYQNEDGVYRFIDSIDWGWFYFLTKPIFCVLHSSTPLIGNMGWSIIALTFIIKALLFPLAYKSYVSMAKMKELQPEMEKLKERAGDDRQKLQTGDDGALQEGKGEPRRRAVCRSCCRSRSSSRSTR